MIRLYAYEFKDRHAYGPVPTLGSLRAAYAVKVTSVDVTKLRSDERMLWFTYGDFETAQAHENNAARRVNNGGNRE